MEGLEDVKRELETKRQELARELESARGKIAALEADLEKVDEALASLSGKKTRSRSKSKKPTPSVDDVRSIVAAVREELPFAEEEELEKAVRARIKKDGKSLAGFKALYAEARPVNGDPFEVDPFSNEGFRQAS